MMFALVALLSVGLLAADPSPSLVVHSPSDLYAAVVAAGAKPETNRFHKHWLSLRGTIRAIEDKDSKQRRVMQLDAGKGAVDCLCIDSVGSLQPGDVVTVRGWFYSGGAHGREPPYVALANCQVEEVPAGRSGFPTSSP